MRSATIRIPAAKFCGTMTAIAEWLDVNGYEPTRYKYDHDEDAVLVTVDFSAGVAAKAFATRFDGIGRFLWRPHHQTLSTNCRLNTTVTVDKRRRLMRASLVDTHNFASSPGAASFSSPSYRCCRRNRWCEPGSPDDLSISSPTLGRLRSLWQVMARADAACRPSAAFGSTPASWNTSSTFHRAGTRRSRISRRRRSERCAAVLLSPSSGGACPSSRFEGCRLRSAVQSRSRRRSAPRGSRRPVAHRQSRETPSLSAPDPLLLLIGGCLWPRDRPARRVPVRAARRCHGR